MPQGSEAQRFGRDVHRINSGRGGRVGFWDTLSKEWLNPFEKSQYAEKHMKTGWIPRGWSLAEFFTWLNH